MQKKSLLFIIPFLPYPLVSGGHQAIYNGIDCVKDDFNIFIAYYVGWGADESAAVEFQKRFPHATLLPMDTRHKAPNFKARVIDKLQRMLAVQAKKFNPPDKNARYDQWLWSNRPQPAKWQQFIWDACEKYHIDIAQVEMPWISSFILSLPDTVKKVYVHHELAFVKHGLELNDDPYNLYAKTCYKHTLASEINMLNHADHIITLSPIDKKKLEEQGVTTPISSSFAVVNTETEFSPYLSDERILTFIGPDDNIPNRVGLRWFLDNCWHALKKEEPAYRLNVIGKWREENKKAILKDYPDVEFLGFVNNLFETMKGTVMIVPITIGSGIRMKILEAASMGIPFVSTTVGAEGIPVKDGHDCFLTNDPYLFVEDILKLQDRNLKMHFIHNANQMVKEHYSAEALRMNRLEIYKQL
jgi:glycosyltransferase involved in cell wall biosynthesis